MSGEELRRRLEYYRDLGVKEIYRAAVPPMAVSPLSVSQPSDLPMSVPAPADSSAALPAMAPTVETLFQIMQDIGDCRRCRLHEGRNKIVFGVGDEHAQLVFVGEGPGADEDEQGIPFVGRARDSC